MKMLKNHWKTLVWVSSILLLVWSISNVSFGNLFSLLKNIKLGQLFLLIILNCFIFAVLSVRWWIILKSQGRKINFLSVVRYRLASFGISYFTPGPLIGGEPMQVYYLRENHGVPSAEAISSVALDKIFDMFINFAFLAFGLTLFGKQFNYLNVQYSSGIAFIFILILCTYLFLLTSSQHSISKFSQWVGKKLNFGDKYQKLLEGIKSSEVEMQTFFKKPLIYFFGVIFFSIFSWILLLYEYWFALKILGLSLNISEVVLIITAARVSLLGPMPGAIGILEASQIWITTVLGFSPVFGAGIVLLIRARDLSFGFFGLLWGGIFTKSF